MLSSAPSVENVSYRLEQEFRYAYESTVRNVRQRLVVAPRRLHGGQVRRSFSFTVEGASAVSSISRDSFGNEIVAVTLDSVDSVVAFRSLADVDLSDVSGRSSVHPATLGDTRYLASTKLTRPGRRLSQVSSTLARSASGAALADLICSWTHEAMEYGFDTTSVHTTASEAARGGRGVCQDFAHIMIALCRSTGLPARYVSGHLVGEGGSHAWVEVLVDDGHGPIAIALDPTHDRRTDGRYLTVAVGRDYVDVAPTSGTFEGACSSMLTSKKHLFVLDDGKSEVPVSY
jgi:transglutaminase-like putative cysteine protease